MYNVYIQACTYVTIHVYRMYIHVHAEDMHDEICCSEAAITTVVMFCGYLVCVCNKGLSQLHGQCVCDCDVVLVSCTICRGIALVLYNRPTGLLVFFFLSICLAVVCYHLMSLL